MLKIFRTVYVMFFCFLVSSLAFAESRFEDEFNRIQGKVLNYRSNDVKLKKDLKEIDNKLQMSSIGQIERKHLVKQREDTILNKFKNKINIKRDNEYLRYLHSRKFGIMDLKVSQKGICQNPCQVSMEAIANTLMYSFIAPLRKYLAHQEVLSFQEVVLLIKSNVTLMKLYSWRQMFHTIL